MIARFAIRERGTTPRKMLKAFGDASREAWYETGVLFHNEMREDRFTQRHATLAGYSPRKPSYIRRKFREKKHTRPLEYSGTAKKLSKTANIVVIGRRNARVEVRYPGARVFNFKNPKSNVNMVAEFTRVTRPEADKLAGFFDRQLDMRLDQ